MKHPVLTLQGLTDQLDELNALADSPWEIIDQKLHKTFEFRNFIHAFGFMTQSAIVAEKLNHHPEWKNVYKTVNVNLVTHESGGITLLDFELARKMEQLSNL
jgi:4a-hydroxytetrahydrobiopterin dehydratase